MLREAAGEGRPDDLGVSMREYLKYGDKGRVNRGAGVPAKPPRATLGPSGTKKHWTWYKARAQRRRSQATEENA